MEEKKSNRGGYREGAGRPKKSTGQVTIRIPEDIQEILERQKSKRTYICNAIRYYEQNKAAE